MTKRNEATEQTTDTTTEGGLLARLQGLKSAIQRDDLVTAKDINPETGKLFTRKDKRVLGIPSENEVVWAWSHFSEHDHGTITGAAKAAGRPVAQLLAEVVMDWFEANRTELETIAAEHRKGDKTDDDLKKELAAAERAVARLRSSLAPKEEEATYAEAV